MGQCCIEKKFCSAFRSCPAGKNQIKNPGSKECANGVCTEGQCCIAKPPATKPPPATTSTKCTYTSECGAGRVCDNLSCRKANANVNCGTLAYTPCQDADVRPAECHWVPSNVKNGYVGRCTTHSFVPEPDTCTCQGSCSNWTLGKGRRCPVAKGAGCSDMEQSGGRYYSYRACRNCEDERIPYENTARAKCRCMDGRMCTKLACNYGGRGIDAYRQSNVCPAHIRPISGKPFNPKCVNGGTKNTLDHKECKSDCDCISDRCIVWVLFSPTICC